MSIKIFYGILLLCFDTMCFFDDEQERIFCFLFSAAISFFGFIITSLIFGLDYYPFIIIDYKEGYCKNTTTNLFIIDQSKSSDVEGESVYFYDTFIYEKPDEAYFIGNANGCSGTYYNSYKSSAGIVSTATELYPYMSYNGNVPAWTCSRNPQGSSLWYLLSDTVDHDEIDNIIWKEEWQPCKYASLKHFDKSWNNGSPIANSGNSDFVANIPIYGSTFDEIINTDHYWATFIFMIIFGSSFIYFIAGCCNETRKEIKEYEKREQMIREQMIKKERARRETNDTVWTEGV